MTKIRDLRTITQILYAPQGPYIPPPSPVTTEDGPRTSAEQPEPDWAKCKHRDTGCYVCYGRCSRVGYVRVFRSGVRHDPGTVMCRICSEIAVRNGDFTETQSE
jgi:hypothetical protein